MACAVLFQESVSQEALTAPHCESLISLLKNNQQLHADVCLLIDATTCQAYEASDLECEASKNSDWLLDLSDVGCKGHQAMKEVRKKLN